MKKKIPKIPEKYRKGNAFPFIYAKIKDDPVAIRKYIWRCRISKVRAMLEPAKKFKPTVRDVVVWIFALLTFLFGQWLASLLGLL